MFKMEAPVSLIEEKKKATHGKEHDVLRRNSENTHNETMVVFLKLEDRIKKTHIESNCTLEQLKQIFMAKFESLKQHFEAGIPSLSIMDRESKVCYQLEDMKDLYP